MYYRLMMMLFDVEKIPVKISILTFDFLMLDLGLLEICKLILLISFLLLRYLRLA